MHQIVENNVNNKGESLLKHVTAPQSGTKLIVTL